MLQIIQICIGVLLIVASVLLYWYAAKKTPDNLRGFYKGLFVGVLVCALIGGLALIGIGVAGLIIN